MMKDEHAQAQIRFAPPGMGDPATAGYLVRVRGWWPSLTWTRPRRPLHNCGETRARRAACVPIWVAQLLRGLPQRQLEAAQDFEQPAKKALARSTEYRQDQASGKTVRVSHSLRRAASLSLTPLESG
jgi:hypothetical protein